LERQGNSINRCEGKHLTGSVLQLPAGPRRGDENPDRTSTVLNESFPCEFRLDSGFDIEHVLPAHNCRVSGPADR
jgi:hypothetical protein